MKNRILFVPIDDRPCTFKMPCRLAPVAGWNLVTPPGEFLGHVHTPGECDELLNWLEHVPDTYDACILCIDMFLYGGLVASRRPDAPFEQVRARMNRLMDILRQRRGDFGPVYAFKTIMRAAPTYTDESTVQHIQKLVEYSCKQYEACHGAPAIKARMQKLEREIPPELLKNYLLARQRNHEINKDLLASMQENGMDFLLFGLDDSRTTGLNIREKEELEVKIAELRLGSRVLVAPGTDESVVLLLARALTGLCNFAPAVYPVYSHPEGKRIVPTYEDRSFEEIVNLHITAAGCRQAESRERADILLYIHNPVTAQREAAQQTIHPRSNRTMKRFVGELAKDLEKKRRVALNDAYYANGADTNLMCQLVCSVNVAELRGFAGWNTTGNSMGTALGHAVVSHVAEHTIPSSGEEAAASAHLGMLIERFADDWLYQAVVRQHASAEAMLRRVSVFHLDEWAPHFDDLVRRKMDRKVRDFYAKYVEGRNVPGFLGSMFAAGSLEKVDVCLPWNRLFEVDVTTAFRLGTRETVPPPEMST